MKFSVPGPEQGGLASCCERDEMPGISFLAEGLLMFQEKNLLHGIGWLVV